MVRVISSRTNRCYSRSGGQRSARNEKLNDITHVVACSALLLDRELPFMPSQNNGWINFSFGSIGYALLLVVQIVDLYATSNAHQMFYRWAKGTKRGGKFLSTPTKVDALIILMYICGGTIRYTSILTVPWNNRVTEGWRNCSNVIKCCIIVAGTITNAVCSVPSLDFIVPRGMARAQNGIVAAFMVASFVRVYCSMLSVMGGDVAPGVHKIIHDSYLFADVIVWVGAVGNMIRVSKLLCMKNHWKGSNVQSKRNGSHRGLLSWFKSSRSRLETSEGDSEDLDDISIELEDEDNGTPRACRA